MKKEQVKKQFSVKQRRIFDESIRKQVVADIEKGKCSVSQASRELGISVSAVYKWLYKYSRYLKSNKIIVVEEKSQSYRTAELEKKIKELEAALGRKSLQVEYLEKIIELAEKDLQTDLKKNIGARLLGSSLNDDVKGGTK